MVRAMSLGLFFADYRFCTHFADALVILTRTGQKPQCAIVVLYMIHIMTFEIFKNAVKPSKYKASRDFVKIQKGYKLSPLFIFSSLRLVLPLMGRIQASLA